MKNKDHRSGDAAERHRRAEKKAKVDEAKMRETLSPEEAQRLFHELRVHQIELEMQNEEMRRAQEALEALRARYFDLYDVAPVGYFSISEPGLILEANLTAAKLLGWEKKQMVKQPISRFIFKEDQDVYYRHRKKLFETGEPQTCELRVVKKDGMPFWARVEATAVRAADGGPACRAAVSDITERMKAEETLRDSEENMRFIVKHDPNAIAVYDRELHYIAVSDRYLQDYDVKEEDVIGKHHYEVFPEMPQKWKDVHQRCLAGAIERNDDDYFERPDGSVTYNRWECRPWRRVDGEIGGIITYTEVTTERKRSENALREREALFRRMFDQAPSGAAMVSLDYRFLIVNEALCRITGYSAEELTCRGFVDITHPDDIEVDVAQARRLGAGEIDHYDMDTRYLRADGSAVWIHLNVRLIRDVEGRALYFLPMMEDITKRKRAEEALRESLERFHLANRATFNAIRDWNLQTDALLWNENFQTLFGYRTEEIEPDIKSWMNGIHPEDLDRVLTSIHAAIASEQDHWFDQYRFRCKDGMYAEIEDRGYIARDAGGKPVRMIGAMQDITERIRSEKAVQASLREKEILLREIHHRVKNNMQIISSLFNLQAGHIKDESARRMLKEGQLRIRSMALVHEKLYQSRDLAKIDFADYLRTLSDHLFLFFQVGSDRIRLEPDLEHVHLDINTAVPCGLLVSELITNALKHAFPAGRKGVIGIRLRRRKDSTVELRVADDGVGLPEALNFRCAESFGLQIVDLLVGQLEGTIELDRTKGTAFTIVFRELGYKTRT
jgi:PAS domain S-box-containing protein